MVDRNERIRIFEETMELCKSHPNLVNCVDYSTREQTITWQEDPVYTVEGRYLNPAKLLLSPQRTFEASRKYANQGKRVCALNFASSVTPGGGVTRGTTAQEESMCRISTLYASISDKETAGAFYERHCQMIHSEKMGRENRDDCIYTPAIQVIREDTFECAMLPESDWYGVDVITCAAPDLRFAENGRIYRPSSAELTRVFENRWRRILSVAAQHQVDILILGAFGCGAFHNPPEIAVRAFNNVCGEFKYDFEIIEFAVFTNDISTQNYQAFCQIAGIEEIKRSEGESIQHKYIAPKIDLDSVNKTIAYIVKHGWGLRNEDAHDVQLQEDAELCGGGSGGICAFKLLQYFVKYIANKAGTMHFRYMAAALSCLSSGNVSVEHYRKTVNAFLSGYVIIAEYLFTGGIGQNTCGEIVESYQKTGAIESYTMLKIIKALEWDDQQIEKLTYLMENNLFR